MRWIVAVALAITLGSASAAQAGDVKIVIGGGFRPPHPPHRHFLVQDRRLEGFGERRLTVVQNPNCFDHLGRYVCGGRPPGATGNPNCYDNRGKYVCGGQPPADHHHRPTIIVPQTIYVAPRANCLVPGYWSYHWVPQTTWYNVWVPGQYSPDWNWIEGHYEPRPHTTYYQQPLWVPDLWAC